MDTATIAQNPLIPLLTQDYLLDVVDDLRQYVENGIRYEIRPRARLIQVATLSESDEWIVQGCYDGNDFKARFCWTHPELKKIWRQGYDRGQQFARSGGKLTDAELSAGPSTVYGQGFTDAYNDWSDES